jgi:hypothetical protein
MQNFLCCEVTLETDLKDSKVVEELFIDVGTGSRRHVYSKDVLQNLAEALNRNEVLVRKIGHKRLYSFPVLNRAFYIFGESPSVHAATTRTLFFFRPVLDHCYCRFGNVEYLARFYYGAFNVAKIRSTSATMRGDMKLDAVWMFNKC